MMTTQFQQDMLDAVEELANLWPDDGDEDEISDLINEIADSSVPVYNDELLQAAVDHSELATSVPEFGPAFDGEPTPINIIAANYYEALAAAMWEAVSEMKGSYQMGYDDGEILQPSDPTNSEWPELYTKGYEQGREDTVLEDTIDSED